MRQRNNAPYSPWRVPDVLERWLDGELLRSLRCIGGRWEEIHLRAGRACSVSIGGENRCVDARLDEGDLKQILLKMCGGSLYAYRDSIAKGYLSPGEGVRVGVCGRAALEDDGQRVLGLQSVDTLCIRFPYHPSGVGEGIVAFLQDVFPLGTLFYAPPGVGKTTLLRAIALHFSSGEHPLRVAVVDTRCELEDERLERGRCLSVLSGYPKGLGIEIATRTLNAQLIVCDEIGNEQEAQAIVGAANCGVPVIASAHAATLSQLLHRPMIRHLHREAVFGGYVGLRRGGRQEDFDYESIRREEVETSLCG